MLVNFPDPENLLASTTKWSVPYFLSMKNFVLFGCAVAIGFAILWWLLNFLYDKLNINTDDEVNNTWGVEASHSQTITKRKDENTWFRDHRGLKERQFRDE